jgi:hypothetical protein
MTNDKPLLSGTVFHYPYLWGYEEDAGIEHAKDRTSCLAISTIGQGGIVFLVIVAISDQASDDVMASLEVPETEIRRAGLNPGRKAYVHVNECNIDPLDLSWNFNPNAKQLGRFGKSFTEKIVASIARNLRAGALRKIDRFESGDNKA